jgi:hypothetical protein
VLSETAAATANAAALACADKRAAYVGALLATIQKKTASDLTDANNSADQDQKRFVDNAVVVIMEARLKAR